MSAAPNTGGLFWPTLCAALMAVALCALGVWQLERLHWKLGLIAAVEARVNQPPVDAPGAAAFPGLDHEALEYRHVTVTGVFRYADEVTVLTSLPEARGPWRGNGYWVMTPLQRANGEIILVNRGFTPNDRRGAETRREGDVAGPVTITGLARWSEDRNAFTPDDVPAQSLWFTRDVAAIAAARNLGPVVPYFIDAETSPPGGLPQGGETRLVFSNRHLEYALTWFGLALGLAGVWAAFVIRRIKDRRGANLAATPVNRL